MDVYEIKNKEEKMKYCKRHEVPLVNGRCEHCEQGVGTGSNFERLLKENPSFYHSDTYTAEKLKRAYNVRW